MQRNDDLKFKKIKENWSAFAPDFKELDENVEYEERESEFDLEDEDKSVHTTKDADEEDIEEVDITTVKPIQAFLSRYSFNNHLFSFLIVFFNKYNFI